MTLLADAVNASRAVTDTPSRGGKVAILADFLRQLDASEIAAAVGFLAGVPRQGRIGIGYSTIYGIERAPARGTVDHDRRARPRHHRGPGDDGQRVGRQAQRAPR